MPICLRFSCRSASIAVLFALTICVAPALADPPGRVARLGFVGGPVSFRPASVDEWTNATLNYPVTIGDHLWIDRGGRAELQVGSTDIRLGPSTESSVLDLDDHVVQLRVTEGILIARIRSLAGDEAVEIDTPNGAVSLVRPGFYRLDVNEAGDRTTVTVRSGEAAIASTQPGFAVRAHETAIMRGRNDSTPQLVPLAATDDFEDWCLARDRHAERAAALRYVSSGVVGYQDLDDYGTWSTAAEYGPVWFPRVHVGWVPYRFGHWAWVEPWGWTWIDDAPWGFAPFHYGRWVYVSRGWAWVPGRVAPRPIYAPALVAFVGGHGWRASVSLAEPVAWCPLGPREPFLPAYRVSPVYLQTINVAHVNVTNINVTNIRYVNRDVPGAVTAVSRETFVRARPVAPVAVAVSRDTVRTAAVLSAPPFAPERASTVGERRGQVAVPTIAADRRVIVNRVPQPAPVPLARMPGVVDSRAPHPPDEAAAPHSRARWHDAQQTVPTPTRPADAVTAPTPTERATPASPRQVPSPGRVHQQPGEPGRAEPPVRAMPPTPAAIPRQQPRALNDDVAIRGARERIQAEERDPRLEVERLHQERLQHQRVDQQRAAQERVMRERDQQERVQAEARRAAERAAADARQHAQRATEQTRRRQQEATPRAEPAPKSDQRRQGAPHERSRRDREQ
jgi:hypothetical protein